MLLLTETEGKAIREAIAWARANPVPWDVVKGTVPNAAAADRPIIKLADRPAGHKRPPSRTIDLPGGSRVSISCEQQPAGTCLHLSLSTGTPQTSLPEPMAMAAILVIGGVDPRQAAAAHSWIEEFTVNGRPGGHALNMLLLIEPAKN